MLNLCNYQSFINFNKNILDTNIINIFLLVLLLLYAFKFSFEPTLRIRQNDIIQRIENCQKDLIKAKNFYTLSEQKSSEILFYLENWKKKSDFDQNKFILLKTEFILTNLHTNFLTTESIIKNFEFKSVLILQGYILFFIVSQIFKKFYLLSEKEQIKIIELNIRKLKKFKYE